MAEQGMINDTGKAGHHDRNKVEGEGAANASGAPSTSGGAEGVTARDPDVRSDVDLSGRTAPSLRGAAAAPGEHDPATSTFEPGGDKISSPDVDADSMTRETVGEDRRGSGPPGR